MQRTTWGYAQRAMLHISAGWNISKKVLVNIVSPLDDLFKKGMIDW